MEITRPRQRPHFIAGAFVAVLLALLAAISLTFLAVRQLLVHPERIEYSLQNADVYASLQKTYVDEALNKNTVSDIASSSDSVITTADVTTVYRDVFSDETIKTYVANLLNQESQWLRGETNTFRADIDISPELGRIQSNLAKLAHSRIDQLPACTAQAIATNTACVPPTTTRQELKRDADERIASSVNDIDSSLTVIDHSTQRRIETLHLPSFYQAFQMIALIAFGAFILISSMLLIRRRLGGVLTIGSAGIMLGLLLIIENIVISRGVGVSRVDATNVVSTVATATASTLRHSLLLYASISGVIGVLFIVISLLIRKSRS